MTIRCLKDGRYLENTGKVLNIKQKKISGLKLFKCPYCNGRYINTELLPHGMVEKKTTDMRTIPMKEKRMSKLQSIYRWFKPIMKLGIELLKKNKMVKNAPITECIY